MARASFQLKDENHEFVKERLVPGQNLSVWYRYATETMIHCDPMLDELYERYEYDKRQDFVETAVMEKLDRVQQESDKTHENITRDNGE